VGENSNIFVYGTRQPKSHQIWPVGRATFLHDVIRRRDDIEKFGTSGKSASVAGGLNAAADQAASPRNPPFPSIRLIAAAEPVLQPVGEVASAGISALDPLWTW
jgi:hypothetical protein